MKSRHNQPHNKFFCMSAAFVVLCGLTTFAAGSEQKTHFVQKITEPTKVCLYADDQELLCDKVKMGQDLILFYKEKLNGLTHKFNINKGLHHKGSFKDNQSWPQLPNRAIYYFEGPPNNTCESCWLFIGEIADSAKVYFDGQLVFTTFDNKDKPLYVRHLSFMLPLKSKDSLQELKIEVFDLNQTLFGLRSSQLVFGSYNQVLVYQIKDFLLRTGITLLSAFALFILFLVFLGVYFFTRNKSHLVMAAYGFITIVYLVSFSEWPRFSLEPLFASGPLHFSLRLMQDLFLFLLTIYIFKKKFNKKAVLAIIVYSALVGFFFVSWQYRSDYQFYLASMYLFSAFLFLPMGYGLYCALMYSDDLFMHRLLVVAFSVLCIMQISDLLVFWQIHRGFFFVKVYPPLILTVFLIALIRRDFKERKRLGLSAELGKVVAQVAHDIRSPLTALNALKKIGLDTDDKKQLFDLITARIDSIADDLLQLQARVKSNSATCLNSTLKNICNEMLLLYSEKVRIQFDESAVGAPVHALVSEKNLMRVLSNLINNSIEAQSQEIQVRLEKSDLFAQIDVVDNGQGAHSQAWPILADGGAAPSSKISGFGLGLQHALSQVRLWNGHIEFLRPSGGKGFHVRILLPLIDFHSETI